MNHKVIIGCILIALGTAAHAQQEPSFSHYWAMEPTFNPATAGKEDMLNVTAAFAMQMVGFEHNPQTLHAAADMPFYAMGIYHGVGLQLMNDDLGLFSHKRLALQYSMRQKLLGGIISGGVQAGLLSEGFDGSRLDLEDSSDPAFSTTDITGTGLDLGAGLYYTHPVRDAEGHQRGNWYAGASVLHLNAPTVELGTTNELAISATYYFTGGYNIQLRNPFLSIHTSALGRTDGVAWRADITGRVRYAHEKRVMYAGLGYSPTNSITVLIGGNFHGIHLGYSYEVYTSAISPANGSHELFVGYQTHMDLYKKGKNLHKSVRIL